VGLIDFFLFNTLTNVNPINLLTVTCNCTLIKPQVDLDKIKTIVNYHCNLCRGMNGSVFSTYAAVSED
jgi:hypothetical protein